MEPRHKRCCFRRSGSMSMISDMTSISSDNITKLNPDVSEPVPMPAKDMPNVDFKLKSKTLPGAVNTDQVLAIAERPNKTPTPFCWLKSRVQTLLQGHKEVKLQRLQCRLFQKLNELNKRKSRYKKKGGVKGKDIEMGEEDVRKLIQLYSQHESLYNPNSSNYGNRDVDASCYIKMARSFPNVTSNELCRYLNELRCIFEREYTIIESARRNHGDIMTPSIQYYNEFLFLVPYLPENLAENQSLNVKSSTSLLSSAVAGDFNSSLSNLIGKPTLESDEIMFNQFGNHNANSISLVMDCGPVMLVEAKTRKCVCWEITNETDETSKCSEAPPELHHKPLSLPSNVSAALESEDERKSPVSIVLVEQQLAESVRVSPEQTPPPQPMPKPSKCEYRRVAPIMSDQFVQTSVVSFPIESCNSVPLSSSQSPESQESIPTVVRRQLNAVEVPPIQSSQQQSTQQTVDVGNGAQLQMLCEMIRTELSNTPDFIYFDAKWRIIEILRDVHKRQLIDLNTPPQDNGSSHSWQRQKSCCPTAPRMGKQLPVSLCPYCCKR